MENQKLLQPGTWYAEFDGNGNSTAAVYSASYRSLLGYETAEEYADGIGTWIAGIHPDDRGRTEDSLANCVSGKDGPADFDCEYRRMTKRGYHWFHDYGRCTRRADGTVLRIDGVLFDIDESVKQRKSLADHRILLDYFVDPYWSASFIDLKNDTLEILRAENANTDAYIMDGTQEDMAKFIDSHFHPEDKALMRKITNKDFVRNELRDKASISYTAREIIDGTEKTMRILIVRGADEDHVAVGFMDITEEILEQQKRLLGTMPLSPDILTKAGFGLWSFELDEGKAPRMYVNEVMLGLLGLNHPVPPEETYHAWYDHIDEGSRTLVNDAVTKMMNGEHAEVQYPWHHPDGHTMIVRCGGVRNPEYTRGIRIEGTCQNVTEVLHFDEEQQNRLRREAEESGKLVRSIADTYSVAFIVNAGDDSIKLLRADENAYQPVRCFREVRDIFLRTIHPSERERLLKEFDYDVIREKLARMNSYNVEYRTVIDRVSAWYQMNVTRISEDEFAVGFADRDIEITKRRLEEKRYDEYFALFVADIDTGMIKVIKNDERYQVCKVGESTAYAPYIQGIAREFEGETREFLMGISDLENVKREFASDDKRTYSYKSLEYAGDRWIDLTSYCILRHEDGTPALITIGFSIVDALATAREELRKRLEDALEKAELEAQRNDVVADIVNAGRFIYEVSAEDEITSALYSDISKERIGAEYIDKMDWIRLLHPEDKDRVYSSFMATVHDHTGNTPYSVTFRMMGVNGKYRWVRSGGNVIRRADGSGEFYGINLDITDQMEEQERQQAQLQEALSVAESANRAKTEFLFNMSHDVRTPMNAILGFTGMAEKHIGDQEKVLDCLRKIMQSGSLLLSLINGVLDMSRIEHGGAEPEENAGDVFLSFASIQATLQEEAGKKDIDLRFEFGEVTDRYVYADFTRCLRVFTNLITNSIKYTREGGRIRVRCEQNSPMRDGYAAFRYTVEDNGIGMSEEFQKHMFESFTREHNSTISGIQGTGLGLAVCKAFVDYLGGTIDCESAPGKGTKFTVILPFRVQEGEYYTDLLTGELVEASRTAETARAIDFTRKKVLLAEDNELNREIANEILEEAGLTVEDAENGAAAVEILKTKGPEYYDFILMDIQMPVMNGYEATKAIREMYPDRHIPIIALSANAFAEDKQKTLEAGMDDHVAKPINLRDLFSAMAKFLK